MTTDTDFFDDLAFGHGYLSLHQTDAVTAVERAISAGLVVQSPHPDFGGTLTVGPLRHACGSDEWAPRFATLSWGTQHDGAAIDLDDMALSANSAARYFVGQVGKRYAWARATAALEAA